MKKADRQKVFEKYGGRCAYCGCELNGKWHVDHIEPIQRITKSVGGNFVTKDNGMEPTEEDFESGNYVQLPRKLKQVGCHNPHLDILDNKNPACVSCNLYKHSAGLETFRYKITNLIRSLNRDSTQYQFGKRYGLVQETGIEVKFYFETLNNQPC